MSTFCRRQFRWWLPTLCFVTVMMTSIWSLFLFLLLFRLLLKERKRCRLVELNRVSRVATRRSLSSSTVIFRKVMLIPAVDQPLVNLYSRFPFGFCEICFQQLGLSCFVFSQLRISDASNSGMLFQGLLYLVLLLGIQWFFPDFPCPLVSLLSNL